MKMEKRGMWSLEFVGKLILALVFCGMGFFMIKNIAEASNVGYDKKLCQISVIANAKGRIAGKEFYNVNCPTRYVTIEPKKYIVESGKNKNEFKIQCGSLGSEESKKCFFNKVNSVVANLIFDCWDQFAAGQLAVFSQYDSERQCLVCARIEFRDMPGNLKNFYSGDSEEYSLTKYMRTHNPIGRKISYYEFSHDIIDDYTQGTIYEYSLEEPMAVVFIAFNRNYIGRMLGWSWDKIKDVASFVWRELPLTSNVPGAEEEDKEYFINTLDFIPYSRVAKECGTLE